MKYFLFILLALLTTHYTLVALPVRADNCTEGSDQICDPLKSKSFEDLAKGVADFIVKLGLYAVAPLMVVIGGFQILTAGGSPEKVSSGWKTIQWALIGVVILLVAWGLVGLIRDILGVTP